MTGARPGERDLSRRRTTPYDGPDALFVYGTLRRGAGGPDGPRRRLEHGAELAGEGTIGARLYDAGGFPAAVPDPSGRVRGEVYELSDPASLLAALDRYEGCRPDGTGLFRREVVTVRMDTGQEREAWVYLFGREIGGMPEIPSGDYLAYAGEPDEEGGERAGGGE